VNVKLAKAMSSELRVKILDTLSKKAMSVSQFIKIFPEYTHSRASLQFCNLLKWEFLELVEIKTGGERRGGNEKFYRANVRSLFDQTSWAELPDWLMNKVTASVFSTLIHRVAEAIAAGTIDIRPDRHVTWSDPEFDQQAWDETIEDVEAVFQRIPAREAEAAIRRAKSGEAPIPVTVALLCFESPPGARTD